MIDILWFKHTTNIWEYFVSVNLETAEVFIVYHDKTRPSRKVDYTLATILAIVCSGRWIPVSEEEIEDTFMTFNVGGTVRKV